MEVSADWRLMQEVFVAHHGQLRNIALNIVRRGELADEIVQEAYLKVAGSSSAARIAKPFCYCCQIVRNLAIDNYRRHVMESGYRKFDVEVEELDMPGYATPEKILSEKQMLEAVEQVLEKLPVRTRQALELCRLDDMSQRDAGRNLGCSATLVNFMIRDASNALRICKHFIDD